MKVADLWRDEVLARDFGLLLKPKDVIAIMNDDL